MTVTRVGKTNSALIHSRGASAHSFGTPVSAMRSRHESEPDSSRRARGRTASLNKRPRVDTMLPSRELTTGVSGAERSRVIASSDTKLTPSSFGAVIAGRNTRPSKGVTGSAYKVTENGRVGVRFQHGRNELRWIRGAGKGVCYRGNRPRLCCHCGRGFHASDVAPLPSGNGQLEYLRCWRLLWSRTLIWARRSASAGLVLGQDGSILSGPMKSQPAH